MADIIKDSYSAASRFFKVIFQRGRKVMDFELNEMQDILRRMVADAMLSGTQTSLGAPVLNPGSNDNGFKIVGTGAANAVTVQAGTLFCDGIPLVNTASFTFNGFTTYGGGGSRTDVVYLQVTEVEVADPAQIPQIGETTLRRQIQVTMLVSTTGLGGVPSNTPSDIFDGGTHYFPIASIDRPSGQAIINAGQVTDLRQLLPPSLIAQAVRQEDFTLAALDATILETPGTGGNPLPESNAMTVDVDPGASFAGGGTLTVRFNREGVPTSPFIVRESLSGMPDNIGSTDTLRFRDVNVAGAAGTSGEEAINFSSGDVTQGDQFLRTWDNVPGTPPSILQALNSRLLTVGDGVLSFGDFNGATAIQDAITHVGIGGAARIIVKKGNYTVESPIIIPGKDIHLEGEVAGDQVGPAQEVVIDNLHATDHAFIVTGGGRLTLRNLAFTNSIGTGTGAAVFLTGFSAFSAALDAENCWFLGQGIYADNVFSASDLPLINVRRCRIETYSDNNQSPVRLEVGDFDAKVAPVLFTECYLSTPYDIPTLNVQCSNSSDTLLTAIIFARCRIVLGSTSATAGAFTDAVNNCGVVRLIPNGVDGTTIGLLAWDDCYVTSAGGASASTILMYLRATVGVGAFISVKTVRISGGRWLCGTSDDSLITPFYIGGETVGASSTNISDVIISNVEWGFGLDNEAVTACKYGAMTSEVGNPGESYAFFIQADRSITVRGVRFVNVFDSSGAGDLCLYRPRRFDVDGIDMVTWTHGGGGSKPAHRIYVESFNNAANVSSTSAGWTGSAGEVSGIVIDCASNGGFSAAATSLVGVRPCGHLVISDSMFSNTISTWAIYLHQSSDSLITPTRIFFEATGLKVVRCAFDAVSNNAIVHAPTGNPANGRNQAKILIDSCRFVGGSRGVSVIDNTTASGGYVDLINCTFMNQSSCCAEFDGIHVNMAGNIAEQGVAGVNAFNKIVIGTVADTSSNVASAHGNVMNFHWYTPWNASTNPVTTPNALQNNGVNASKGFHTGYYNVSADDDTVGGVLRVHQEAEMVHNRGALKFN